MTQPLTDAELLARKFHEAYERLAPSFGYETRAETRAFDPSTANGKLMVAVCAEISRAFHANEQRVREEEREACAKVCDAPHMTAAEYIGITNHVVKMKVDLERGLRANLAAAVRALNGSTAPQPLTAGVSTAPSPEGVGQGEAAEAVGLLRDVKQDLEYRAEDGVVELSINVWQRLCDFLAKQGRR